MNGSKKPQLPKCHLKVVMIVVKVSLISIYHFS